MRASWDRRTELLQNQMLMGRAPVGGGSVPRSLGCGYAAFGTSRPCTPSGSRRTVPTIDRSWAPRNVRRKCGHQQRFVQHSAIGRRHWRRPSRIYRPGWARLSPCSSVWVGLLAARRTVDECPPANRPIDCRPGSVSDSDQRWGRADSWETSGARGEWVNRAAWLALE